MKGLYSLEEYYAQDLASYYEALTVGPSHNYYMGRAGADITKWVEYFCEGTATSFENVKKQAEQAGDAGRQDASHLLRGLEPRQRRVLELFQGSHTITSRDAEKLFAISQRMARNLLSAWVANGFLVIADMSKKKRKYELAAQFRELRS